jgi:ABC-type glycerol-3-phosphate transport system permease component
MRDAAVLRRGAGLHPARAAIYVSLVLGASVGLLPLFWMLMSSFKTHYEETAVPPVWFPAHFDLHNYVTLFGLLPFGQFIVNSLVIVAANLVGTLVSCTMVAYAFARYRAPGRDFLFGIVLLTMMIPGIVTMIPLYTYFFHLGWNDTPLPLTVPSFFATNSFAIFLLRQFFRTVPGELFESARLDGCSEPGILVRILVPLSRPALITLGLFVVSGVWQDFVGPILYLQTVDHYTLAQGVLTAASTLFGPQGDFAYELSAAGEVILVAPLLLLFLAAQRYFMQGIAVTGLKG